MGEANRAQAEFWEELAPSWLASERHVEVVSGRFGSLAIDELDLQPGERVLDIGCGSGLTTLELARRVGTDGQAVGADIAPSMLVAGRRHAEDAGLANATFIEADTQTADLGRGAFDALFSQFGVMFFDDPAAAFANLRHVLRPGGRLVFLCWQDLFANEWMFVPGAAVIGVTGVLPPMPGPGEPGPFSLSDADRVEALLTGAGFTDVQVTPQAMTVVRSEAEIPWMVEMSSHVGPVHEALKGADDEVRDRVLAAVHDAFAERLQDGEIRLSAAALMVRATR